MNLKLPAFCLLAAGLLLAAGSRAAVLPGDWLAKVDSTLISTATEKGKADFLIYMDSRADLSMAEAAKTREARGNIVYQILKAHAASSQKGVLADLAARGVKHRSYWISNAISGTGTLADIQLLALRDDVAHIYLVKPEKVNLPGGTEETEATTVTLANNTEAGNVRVRAPAVWALGFTGQGVVVGDHDIGVEWTHPALKTHYRGWNPTTSTASHDYNWRNAFEVDSYCGDPAIPCDPNSHGTHTTGTMVGLEVKANGDREEIGMAPSAQWIACRSLYDDVAGAGTVPTYMDCMEWMIAPYPINTPAMADPNKSPDVVNNSWGCLEACAPPLLKDVNDATKAAGIVQVVSAGNDGDQCSTIIAPLAVYDSSFTVGASNTVNEGMASFSSRGPVLVDGSMRIKPDIVAPGVNTRSSVPGDGYGTKSGTSMAGPHVAGLVALVMSAEPRLKGRVDDVRNLIQRTAFTAVASTQTCGGIAPATLPNNVFGHGRIDALAAVLARPQLTVTPVAPESVIQGEAFTATVAVTQPSGGKIDVTKPKASIKLAPGLEFVSAAPAPLSTTSGTDGTVLNFERSTALAPGASWSISLQLKGRISGSWNITTAAEAEQVSPITGGSAITTVASGLEPFSFQVRRNVPVNTVISSETLRPTGFTGALAISVAGGAQYRLNSQPYTSAPGSISAGDSLSLRHVSASATNATKTSTVTVDQLVVEFSSITSAADRVPAAFSFGSKTGQEPATLVVSDAITLEGFDVAVPVIAGPGVEYRMGEGDWTRANGTLQPLAGGSTASQTLQLRHTSSSASLGYTKTYLKVGGVTGYFTTRTRVVAR